MGKAKSFIKFIEKDQEKLPRDPKTGRPQIRLIPDIKRKANEYLSEISKEYHSSISITDIFNKLKEFGIVVLQEDGTPWSGFITGNEGKMNLDIAPRTGFPEFGDPDRRYTPFPNAMLVFRWYKMSETGNYEINAYIS